MAERITIQSPIRYRDPLPEAADIVIIGGGVIGVFTALYLAQDGLKVCLLEKGRIAGEQSSRNWGWIRQHGRDAAEIPIVTEALALWHEVETAVNGACGLRTCGVNYLASSEKEMESLLPWLDIAKEHGLSSKALSARETAALFGEASNGQWVGATCTPDDAVAEPWQAVPAVAKLAHEAGVTIIENCAVRSLDLQGGNIKGVYTELGKVRCEQVVLAAGAWSSLFARNHGVLMPQLAVQSTVVKTKALPEFTSTNSADEKLAIRRRADGAYSLAICDGHDFYIGPDAFRHFMPYMPVMQNNLTSTKMHLKAPRNFPDSWTTKRKWLPDEMTPFENCRILEPTPNKGFIQRIERRFKTRFPKGGDMQIADAWAGMIDAMPDVVPIIDRADGLNGMIIATGMSGHGFGIGPGVGMVIARMAQGQAPGHDLTRFRHSRFSDGSKLALGPGL